MLIVTLVLAAVGFAFLVLALVTNNVIWAWGCILTCIIGALTLLVSALSARREPNPAPGRSADPPLPPRD
jgi:hypothetical protein